MCARARSWDRRRGASGDLRTVDGVPFYLPPELGSPPALSKFSDAGRFQSWRWQVKTPVWEQVFTYHPEVDAGGK